MAHLSMDRILPKSQLIKLTHSFIDSSRPESLLTANQQFAVALSNSADRSCAQTHKMLPRHPIHRIQLLYSQNHFYNTAIGQNSAHALAETHYDVELGANSGIHGADGGTSMLARIFERYEHDNEASS